MLAHFGAEHQNAKEQRIAKAVRRVDWRETAGELGALLVESDWIKQQKPLLNRRLKGGAATTTLRMGPTPTSQIRIVAVDALDRSERADSFGLFRSVKDANKALADIARAQQLCLKAMGLEDAAGSCFAYQVGRCRGACLDKEPAVMHALRLRLALSALKLQAWPFPGRIALREEAAFGAREWHILEDWDYLGTARDDDELEALAGHAAEPEFDADVYRILARHFATTCTLDWRDLSVHVRSPS